jgi:hypothetical protein
MDADLLERVERVRASANAADEAGPAVGSNGRSPPRLRAAGDVYSRIAPRAVDWLWPGVLARGFCAEITGDPGVGKSLLTCEIAARLSTGRPLPGGTATEPAGVVIVSLEDDPSAVVRGRLEAAGADLSRVYAMTGVLTSDDTERDAILPADLDALRDAIARVDATLVTIDPLLTALDGRFDTHKDADVKRALRPLTLLAADAGVAILGVRHPSKGDKRAILRAGGSIGITGTARVSTYLAVDPDDPERRLLLPVKSNLGARPEAWGFAIISQDGLPRIAWDVISRRLTADDVLAQEHADADERSALSEACEWLNDFLLSPKPVQEIKREARAAGFSERTLERAKSRLGLRATKSGFGCEGQWSWARADHVLRDDDA